MGAGAQKSGGAEALPAPPPPRSLILENNDCIVLMATGGGKTEYYEVFGIILPRFTIVVTPVIGYTWSLSWQTCGSIKFSSKVF